jgi:hypothetical protein
MCSHIFRLITQLPKYCTPFLTVSFFTWLRLSLNKLASFLNQTLFNKVTMYEILAYLTSINQTPIYSEHVNWTNGGSA